MIDYEKMITALSPLVGWEQSKSEEYALSETSGITESESGLYFQDAHPMLTLRAINGIMPEEYGYGIAEYTSGTYSKGQKVLRSGDYYISKCNNNTETPSEGCSNWEKYNLLNDYLDDLEKRGIKKVLQRFESERLVKMETRNIIEKRNLFDGMGSVSSRTVPNGRFVGFELEPYNRGGIYRLINSIGVQFVGNTGAITIYVFNESVSQPVTTRVLSYTNINGALYWTPLNLNLSSYNYEGKWYIGYYESDLPSYMESINFNRDWSREPCGTCNKGDAILWRTLNKYMGISPFYVTEFNGTMWDTEDIIYVPGNNFGLNLNITIGCDITNALLTMKSQFATAIQLQVATDSLRALALNPEVSVNRVQYNADRDNILFETEGNGQGIKGLRADLERAYKALAFDSSNIDPYCLVCKNKGIKISSI